MSNLANILAPSSNLPLLDNEPKELPNQDKGGSFDEVMSQALSPGSQKPSHGSTPNNGVRAKIQPLHQNSQTDDQAQSNTHAPAVNAKTHATTEDSDSVTSKSSSTSEETKETKTDASQPAPDPDNAQNIQIPFLPLNLSALFLSPATISTGPTTSDVAKGLTGVDAVLGATQGQGSDLAKTAVNEGNKTAKAATTTKNSPNSAAPATSSKETAKRVTDALKDLGLSGTTPDSTPAKADKIAGANLTTAKIDPIPENGEKPTNAGKSAKNEGQTATVSTGTAVANDESPMKKADNTKIAAGQSEKVLPGVTFSSARVSNSLRAGSASASSVDQPTATNIIPLSSALDRASGVANSPEPVAVTNLSDIQTRTLERTHEMVTMNALRLASGQTDSMQVVLKPGAGTQLSLELRQRGDVIEAQAVLQHGDYQSMNQHWPDLQQRLEQKGIKLGSLGSDESAMTFNGHQGHSQNQSSSPEQDALFASAFAEFSLAGSMTGISAPVAAAAGRGSWETWA